MRLIAVLFAGVGLFCAGILVGRHFPPAEAPVVPAARPPEPVVAASVEDARVVAFWEAVEARDRDRALAHWEALADDPDADALTASVRARLLEPLGSEAVGSAAFSERLALVEDLLWLYPRDEAALEALARARERQGDLEGALARWWQLAEHALDPLATRARRRARVLVDALVDGARTRGDSARLRAIFDDALARDPAQYALRLRYARVLHEEGEHDAALAVLEALPGDRLLEPGPARLRARIADSAALARAFPEGLPLTRDGNHFLVDVTTRAGESLRLLLDTGATVSVLRPSLLARLPGARATERRVRLGTAGGVVTATVHRVEGLQLGSAELAPIDIAGLGLDGLTGIDGLLGSDVLSRFDYRLDPVAARLHLGRRLR